MASASYSKDEEDAFLGSSEAEGDGDNTLPSYATDRRRPWWATSLSVGALLTLLVISLSLNVWTVAQPNPGIFSTDMIDARRAIEYETRTFTGALKIDPSSGDMVRDQDAEIEYFGPPSSAIETAWMDLLRG